MANFMDVGDDGQAQGFADFSEDGQRCLQTDAALAGQRGAVGLIVGRLVDETDAEPGRDLL
jgi:hypothetical protein